MLRSLGDASGPEMRVEAPICIVGGGIAGLLTAVEASRTGLRVIVIESGERKPQGSLDHLNEVEQDEFLYQTAVSGRVRSLGGTSTRWGGRMIPLTAHDLGPRDYLGFPGWPIGKAALDATLPAVERLFRLDHSSYEAFPGQSDLPSRHEDLATRWAKWPKFRRRNVAHVLRRAIRTRADLDIWLGATACDFILDDASGRLKGVVARNLAGRRLTVSAEQFVFACGTLETTRLLLLLDLTGRQRVFDGCDALGRYFHDHLALEIGRLNVIDPRRVNRAFGYFVRGSTRRSLHLETTAAAQRQDAAASGFVTVRPEFGAGSLQAYARSFGKAAQDGRWRDALPRFNLMADARAFMPGAYYTLRHGQMYFGPSTELFLDARIEQVPKHQSRLSLGDQRDSFGIPQLRIAWHRSEEDAHTFRSVLGRAQSYWRSSILNEAVSVDWNVNWDSEARLFARTRDTRHPAGTARMGLDRRSSVVNADLRCHAVPNLLVVSAAVFPASGSANPTLTIMQLALRAGAQLAAG